LIKEMTNRVRHRGPDDAGYYVNGRVALGHRRLSIIDLTSAGHQPMSYADDRYTVTYNGEIYNYLELRDELRALGCKFSSDSDTEVILAAYATWGSRCLTRFNGMWAFAIHDCQRGVVFAARDRFGVKPFYYVDTDQCFAFGSEISQLLPLLPAVRADANVLTDYLMTGVHAQTEDTFFDRINALMPGHFMEYDVTAEAYQITRYYNLLERVASRPDPVNETEAISAIRDLVEDSVRLRLRSDVRVGTCLSGGIDSSSIALLAANMYRRSNANSFAAITAVSEDPRNSEEGYAAEVVKAGDLAWVKVKPDYDAFRKLLPQVVRHQEEPFSTPSICMQAFVMQAAREQGVVVLLDGQGADETFLGYDKYYSVQTYDLWRRDGMSATIAGLHAATRNNANMSPQRLAGLLAFMLLPGLRRQYYRMRSPFMITGRMPPWIGELAANVRDSRRLQVQEVESTMLPPLLRYEDKNSMAFAIETRLPFLDYRLVEYAVGLAPSLKVRDGWTKWALRQAMNDVLPQEIAWRKRKIGFEAPTDIWLRRHYDIMLDGVRRSALLTRFCDMPKLLRRYPRLDRNHQWRLYNIAQWEETFCVTA